MFSLHWPTPSLPPEYLLLGQPTPMHMHHSENCWHGCKLGWDQNEHCTVFQFHVCHYCMHKLKIMVHVNA